MIQRLWLNCKSDVMIILRFFVFFIICEPLVRSTILPPECLEHVCGNNGTYKDCPSPCQGTCSNPAGSKICPKICLEDGCECYPGYVLHNGRCILLEDCPDHLRCNDHNATQTSCPNPCPRTCEYPAGPGLCIKQCRSEGCECKDGFYLNDHGKCVKLQDCPGAKNCSATETFVFCHANCPTDFCPDNDSQAMIACSPPFPCKSGCACKANHLRRRSDGKCIPASHCPPIHCKRPNEILNKSPPPCLNERCSNIATPPVPCDWFPTPSPKCVCEPGYCRNDLDICVPNTPQCDIPFECRPTCAVPNPPGCEYYPSENNQHGCSCRPGFVLSKLGGHCVEIEKCPSDIGCNGDPHAVIKQYPKPCPSTCDQPNAFNCNKMSEPLGCECRPEYILCDGKCILPNDCPGGNPCGQNGIFVPCKFDSPSSYCSTKDSTAVIISPPPTDCLSGCVCKKHYKMLSRDNQNCVRSEDCPPDICSCHD